MKPSLSLLTMLCALSCALPSNAQDLVPLPDPYIPYQEGDQGRFEPKPLVEGGEKTTANAVLWQQYQALQNGTAAGAAASGCQSCGGGGGGCGCGPCDRCSCTAKNFPWFEGPGHCDNWCVGPHWGVEASTLIVHREDTNLNGIIANVGAPTSVEDQFDYAPGARVFATAYNCHGWGMQIGYEGLNDWDASVVFPDSPAVASTRSIDYMSRLNSVEFNFLPRTPQPWKLFSGLRYVELDEDLQDFTIVDRVIPVPADPPAVPAAFVDTGLAHIIENHMLGFQLGGLRDGWQVGDWLLFSGFANAGVYHNQIKRDDVNLNITTVITGDDLATPVINEFSETTTVTSTTVRREFSDVSFLGEAGASVSLKLTPCLALKSGYQVILIDGVGQGIDAFFSPAYDSSTVLYHGLQFGLEYRR
jgi:hypothetical protein